MKILCTGDLHIGRRPSRLPATIDAAEHSCAAAWHAIVETAIAQRVDLVALSGDLVDQSNRYFQAVGPLESGLRRLAERDIPAVAVAGNHDHDVLPRLADTIGGTHFRLLGRGGRWERATFDRPGGRVHVDGWSFPQERVMTDPLLAYDLATPGDGAPVLGLLHAELGAASGHYAPVTLDGLRQRGCAFWLLGHIHAPALHAQDGLAPVLYPGSPQGMDPGEPGCHGAWIVELRAGEAPVATRLPLATVRYETVELDLDGLEDAGEIEGRAVAAVRERLHALAAERGPLRWLSVRLRVTGRTSLRREVERRLDQLGDDPIVEVDGVSAHVERVAVEVRPTHDLT
ncbi:MAG TPA: DNA repair exonuclease, partial [Gemmatimonadaceae bacterium]|nr:DNA repair exonuclease [Gemmatimonadaceae bacterium]